MKYAFIALIACYLLVYGCGPDTSKKTEAKKEQAVHSTVEKPTQPTAAGPPQETIKQPVAAAVSETPQATPQVATATPSAQPMLGASPQPPVVTEEQKTSETGQVQQPPCPMMTQRQGAVELTQPDEENIVVMPCGCMFIKHTVPANSPCVKQLTPPCPMKEAKQPTTEDELIIMPCGRVMVRPPMPPTDGPGSEQPMQMEPPCQDQNQAQAAEESEADLTSAVQKMVEATNDMLLVTKQLVVATQEMTKMTRGATSEGVNIQKETPPVEQPSQAAQQGATGTERQLSAKEQEMVNVMKDAVMASQKAIDAMNQSAPKTLNQQQ